jgi:hypothetical protein
MAKRTRHTLFAIVEKYTTPRPCSANDVLMATFLPPSHCVWQVEALPIWPSKERGWRESRRQLKVFGLIYWESWSYLLRISATAESIWSSLLILVHGASPHQGYVCWILKRTDVWLIPGFSPPPNFWRISDQTCLIDFLSNGIAHFVQYLAIYFIRVLK